VTKVTVQAGACGFTVNITAEKEKGKKVKVILDTECEMVRKMQEDIAEVDMLAIFTNHMINPVYKSASQHVRHVACPVISGILKAIEAEAGLSVPRDVSIVFSKD